jgi:hypothetical protein
MLPEKTAIETNARLVREMFTDKKWIGTRESDVFKGTKLRGTLMSIVQDITGNENERMLENQRQANGCKT